MHLYGTCCLSICKPCPLNKDVINGITNEAGNVPRKPSSCFCL